MSWDYYRERIRQTAEAQARSMASSHAGAAAVSLNIGGASVQMGEGSSMTNCTVLCPLRVGKNTHLSSCVIGSSDGTGEVVTIGDGCEIHGVSLTGVVEIQDGSRVFDSGLRGNGAKRLGKASTLVGSLIICSGTGSDVSTPDFLSGKGLVLVHAEIYNNNRGSVTVGADAVVAAVEVSVSTMHGIVIGDRALFSSPGSPGSPARAPVSCISFESRGRKPMETGSDVSILGNLLWEAGDFRVADGATVLNGEESMSSSINAARACMRIKSLEMGRKSVIIFGRNDWYRMQAREIRLGGRSRLVALHCPPDRRASLVVPSGETMVI